MTLKTKIFLRSVMLSVILIATIIGTHVVYLQAFNAQQFDERYKNEIVIQAARLERFVLWDDRMNVTALLESAVASDERLVYAFVERGGRPYAYTFHDGVPRALLGRSDRGEPQCWEFKDKHGEIMHDLSVWIGDTDAVLHIGHSVRKQRETLIPLLKRTGVVGVASLLVALALSWLLALRTTLEVHKANQALVESMKKYRSTMDAVPIGIYISQEGLLRYVNPSMARMFGYEPGEMEGRLAPADLVAPERRDLMERIQDASGGAGPRECHGLQGRRSDGVRIEIILREVPVVHEGRSGWVGTVVDITERKKLEDQLREVQKLETVGQLAGGIAHEFNNMIQGINGYAYIAQGELEPDHPARESIRQVIRGGERAAALVSQILGIGQRQMLTKERIDLNAMIEPFAAMMRRALGDGVDFDLRLDAALEAVEADPGQVEQALMNLCMNAREAMPDGGTITIETQNVTLGEEDGGEAVDLPPGRYALLRLADTGCGMGAETLGSIFEPFFTTKPFGQCAGLGLAEVYGIVKQHDGAVRVESRPGQGATFFIYLPVAGEAKPDERR